MPAFMPAAVLRNSVALATAARHMDCTGGRPKLVELIGSMKDDELATAAICLARLVGISNTDEQLQRLGAACLEDGTISI